jgi:hypothetical protein
MTPAAGQPTQRPRRASRGRLAIVALVAAGVAGLVGANAHLVYVSVMSQPDCVPHAKAPASDTSGTLYQAARSSC